MPTPNAIEAAELFRKRLASREVAAFKRMTTFYISLLNDLNPIVNKLALDVSKQDELSLADIRQLAAYQSLFSQLEIKLNEFAIFSIGETSIERNEAAIQGLRDSLQLINESLPESLSQAKLGASFNKVSLETVETALGLTQDTAALRKKIAESYSDVVSEQVEQSLLNGIVAGKNPKVIASTMIKNIESSSGFGLTQALNTFRTAQIKSYQTSTSLQYRANQNIVPTWIWWSSLDDRTCMSCVNQHGSEHPVTEILNDHHQGRCVMLPKAVTFAELGIEGVDEPVTPIKSGEEWFKEQPASTQLDMMGPGKFALFEAGELNFEDLSKPYEDEVYGELLRETPLKDLAAKKIPERKLEIMGGNPNDDLHEEVEKLYLRLSEENPIIKADVKGISYTGPTSAVMTWVTDQKILRFQEFLSGFDPSTVDRIIREWNKNLGTVPGGLEETLIHEFGHTIMTGIRERLQKKGGGLNDEFFDGLEDLRDEIGSPSDYARTNLGEWVSEQYLVESKSKKKKLRKFLDKWSKKATRKNG